MMKWIDRTGLLSLVAVYVAVLIISPPAAALLFFFPIWPIYSLMGWEFSNLGPIATFFWGILFDVFVATPVFIATLLIKLARASKHPKV